MINKRDKIDILVGWIIIGDAIAHLLPLIIYEVFQLLLGTLLIIGFVFLYFIEKKKKEEHSWENIVCSTIIFFYLIITLAYCKYVR